MVAVSFASKLTASGNVSNAIKVDIIINNKLLNEIIIH